MGRGFKNAPTVTTPLPAEERTEAPDPSGGLGNAELAARLPGAPAKAESWAEWWANTLDADAPAPVALPEEGSFTGLLGTSIGSRRVGDEGDRRFEEVTAALDLDGNMVLAARDLDASPRRRAEAAFDTQIRTAQRGIDDARARLAELAAQQEDLREETEDAAALELSRMPAGDDRVNALLARERARAQPELIARLGALTTAEQHARDAELKATDAHGKLVATRAALTDDNAADLAHAHGLELTAPIANERSWDADLSMSEGTLLASATEKPAGGPITKASAGLLQSGSGTALLGGSTTTIDKSRVSADSAGVALVTTPDASGVGVGGSRVRSDDDGGSAVTGNFGLLTSGAAGAAGGGSAEQTLKRGVDTKNRTRTGILAKTKVSGDGAFEVTVRPRPDGRYEVVLIVRLGGSATLSPGVGRESQPGVTGVVTGALGASFGASGSTGLESGQILDEADTLAFLADCEAVDHRKPTTGRFPSLEQLAARIEGVNIAPALDPTFHLTEGQTFGMSQEGGFNAGVSGKLAGPLGGAAAEANLATRSTWVLSQQSVRRPDGQLVDRVTVRIGTTDSEAGKASISGNIALVGATVEKSAASSKSTATTVSIDVPADAPDRDALLRQISEASSQADLDRLLADPRFAGAHESASSGTHGGAASLGLVGSDTFKVDTRFQRIDSSGETLTPDSATVFGEQDGSASLALGGVTLTEGGLRSGVRASTGPQGASAVLETSASGRTWPSMPSPGSLVDSLARKGLASAVSEAATDPWTEVRAHISLSAADLTTLAQRAATPHWSAYGGALAGWKALGETLASPAPAGELDDPLRDRDLTRLRALAAMFRAHGRHMQACLTNVLDNWQSEDEPNVGVREEWPADIVGLRAEWDALGREIAGVRGESPTSSLRGRTTALLDAIDGCETFRDPVAKSTMIETLAGWRERLDGGHEDDMSRMAQLATTFYANKREENTQMAWIRAESEAWGPPMTPFSTRFADATTAIARLEELYERWIERIVEYRLLQADTVMPESMRVSATRGAAPNPELEPDILGWSLAARDLEARGGAYNAPTRNHERRLSRFGGY